MVKVTGSSEARTVRQTIAKCFEQRENLFHIALVLGIVLGKIRLGEDKLVTLYVLVDIDDMARGIVHCGSRERPVPRLERL